MKSLNKIKRDHEEIRGLLADIDSMMKNKEDSLDIINKINELGDVWDEHEEVEMELLSQSKIRVPEFTRKAMLHSKHKELKGHWKVLKESVMSGNKAEVSIFLDTDGRMILNKFRNHIDLEDACINKAIQEHKKQII